MLNNYEFDDHYKEALNGKANEPIYIGHLKDVGYYRDDVLKKNHDSVYLGRIFCPERDKDGYTYEKNKNWMLGGIHAKRPFLLVSSLDHYLQGIGSKMNRVKSLKSKYGYNARKQDVVNGEPKSDQEIKNIGVTYDELRWLRDFGYRFESDNNGGVLAIPPKVLPNNATILSYEGLCGNVCSRYVVDELYKLQQFLLNIKLQCKNSRIKVASPLTKTLSSAYGAKTILPIPSFMQQAKASLVSGAEENTKEEIQEVEINKSVEQMTLATTSLVIDEMVSQASDEWQEVGKKKGDKKTSADSNIWNSFNAGKKPTDFFDNKKQQKPNYNNTTTEADDEWAPKN